MSLTPPAAAAAAAAAVAAAAVAAAAAGGCVSLLPTCGGRADQLPCQMRCTQAPCVARCQAPCELRRIARQHTHATMMSDKKP
jgi:hypothetical protein